MPLDEESPEFSAGGIKRSLLIFAAVVEKGSAEFDHLGEDLVHRPPSQRRVVVEIADELAAELCVARTWFALLATLNNIGQLPDRDRLQDEVKVSTLRRPGTPGDPDPTQDARVGNAPLSELYGAVRVLV
jgi:hypothetical protein